MTFYLLQSIYNISNFESSIQNICFQDHASLAQVECSLEKIEEDDHFLIRFIKSHKGIFLRNTRLPASMKSSIKTEGGFGFVFIILRTKQNHTQPN